MKKFAFIIPMLICQFAAAHAFVDHADPRVGSTINSSPPQMRIWFTQEIEPAFSAIKVADANGNQVDKSDSHLADDNRQLLEVSLSNLPAGAYKVSWHVVSVDTHKTAGDFTFTIKP